MTRFEVTEQMRELTSQIKWLSTCNRRITGIWNKKNNEYQEVQREEYKEYQGNCDIFLQQMSTLLKCLSVENLYPHNDKYNRFNILYILYSMKKKQKELSNIVKKNKLIPKRLYQVAPDNLTKYIESLEEVKQFILKENAICLDFSDNKDVLRLTSVINVWLQLVNESRIILPMYMSDKVEKLYNSLLEFQEYSAKEIKTYDQIEKQYDKIGSLLADIIISVSALNKERETINRRAIMPIRVIDEIYNIYKDIDKTIRKTNAKTKYDYYVSNNNVELPELDIDEKVAEISENEFAEGVKATKEERILYYKELKKKLKLIEDEVNNHNVFSVGEKFMFNDRLRQVQRYCTRMSEYLEGKRKYPFAKPN